MADKRKLTRIRLTGIADGIASFNIYSPHFDAEGKQTVDRQKTFNYAALHDSLIPTLALQGVASALSNRHNRLDEWTPAIISDVFDKLVAELSDGTWTPGRTWDEREPTDLELAVAEATGQDIAAVMRDFDERIVLNADGTPKLDKRGHKSRVFTKTMQDNLAKDPAIRPILARLADERAKRLRAEAKSASDAPSTLGSLFAAPAAEPQAEAAQ